MVVTAINLDMGLQKAQAPRKTSMVSRDQLEGRTLPHSRGKTRTAATRVHNISFLKGKSSKQCDSLFRSNRGVLVLDGPKMNLQESWDEKLTPEFLSQDRNLAKILQEIDDISKALKSNPLDAHALSEALQRTALCAIWQSAVDSELRSLATIDDLTGLYNRRAFHALSTQQLKVMRRNGQGLLLFFADVDHLKKINDTFGHREGDLALVRAAHALERTFRDSDILARFGGDEFAVLALEASSRDRDAILRRLDGHLQKASAEEPRYKLSLSVGAARFDPRDRVSIENLLGKADQAMYEQKNRSARGRMSRP